MRNYRNLGQNGASGNGEKWTKNVCWRENQENLMMKTMQEIKEHGESINTPRFLDVSPYWMVMPS